MPAYSPDHAPVCPHCHLPDKTYKVSLLFQECSARLQQHATTNQPELEAVLADLLPGEADPTRLLNSLAQSLMPPSGEQKAAQRLHPDAIAGLVGLVVLLFAFLLTTNRPGQIPILLILLVAGLSGYTLVRKTVIQRYQAQMQQEQAENQRIEQAISRWTGLYFCSRDQGVFDPEQSYRVPLEQIGQLLAAPSVE